MGFGEDHHGGEAPFSSHHIEGICYQHDLLLLMVTLITHCWLGLSTVKLLYPTPYLSIWYSSAVSHCINYLLFISRPFFHKINC